MSFDASQFDMTYSGCHFDKHQLINMRKNFQMLLSSHKILQWIFASSASSATVRVWIKLNKRFRCRNINFFDHEGHHPSFFENVRSSKQVVSFVCIQDDAVKETNLSAHTFEALCDMKPAKRSVVGKKLQDMNAQIGTIMREHPEAMYHYRTLEESMVRFRKQELSAFRNSIRLVTLPRDLPNTWNLHLELSLGSKKRHFWLWSKDANYGKSQWLEALETYISLYIKRSDVGSYQYWDNYCGEKIIVLDEFNEAELKATVLNKLCDGRVELRNCGTVGKEVTVDLVIVCANKSIQQMYPESVNLLEARFVEHNLNSQQHQWNQLQQQMYQIWKAEQTRLFSLQKREHPPNLFEYVALAKNTGLQSNITEPIALFLANCRQELKNKGVVAGQNKYMTAATTSLQLFEGFDIKQLEQMLGDFSIDLQTKRRLLDYQQRCVNEDIVKVCYRLPIGRSFGRLYADCGLQTFKRDIRERLAAKIYCDLDIQNCYPSLLLGHAKLLLKHGYLTTEEDFSSLELYCLNREALILAVIEFLGLQFQDHNQEKKAYKLVKPLFNTIINGGSVDAWIFKSSFAETYPNFQIHNQLSTAQIMGSFSLQRLQQESERIGTLLKITACQPENQYSKMLNLLLKDYENYMVKFKIPRMDQTERQAKLIQLDRHDHADYSFVTFVLEDTERFVMAEIDQVLRLHGCKFDVIIHDGGLVRKGKALDHILDALLEDPLFLTPHTSSLLFVKIAVSLKPFNLLNTEEEISMHCQQEEEVPTHNGSTLEHNQTAFAQYAFDLADLPQDKATVLEKAHFYHGEEPKTNHNMDAELMEEILNCKNENLLREQQMLLLEKQHTQDMIRIIDHHTKEMAELNKKMQDEKKEHSNAIARLEQKMQGMEQKIEQKMKHEINQMMPHLMASFLKQQHSALNDSTLSFTANLEDHENEKTDMVAEPNLDDFAPCNLLPFDNSGS